MPGKINPVVAESVNQIHAQIQGNDATVAAGGSHGQLELNLYKPVVAQNFLESARLLTNGAETFATRFVANLEAEAATCEQQVDRSLALATALNPAIGYDAAAKVAKTALEQGLSIREAAVQEGYLTEEAADTVVDPLAMTEPGILSE
jgi:fumarate hydratase class II